MMTTQQMDTEKNSQCNDRQAAEVNGAYRNNRKKRRTQPNRFVHYECININSMRTRRRTTENEEMAERRGEELSVSMILVQSVVQSCVGGQQSVNADYHIKFNDSKTHSHLRRATQFKYYFIMHSMPKWCDLIPPRANVHFLRI